VRSIKPDIARVIMKEQNKDIIQYHPAKERPISGLGTS
jgi:hypothetical protein